MCGYAVKEIIGVCRVGKLELSLWDCVKAGDSLGMAAVAARFLAGASKLW